MNITPFTHTHTLLMYSLISCVLASAVCELTLGSFLESAPSCGGSASDLRTAHAWPLLWILIELADESHSSSSKSQKALYHPVAVLTANGRPVLRGRCSCGARQNLLTPNDLCVHHCGCGLCTFQLRNRIEGQCNQPPMRCGTVSFGLIGLLAAGFLRAPTTVAAANEYIACSTHSLLLSGPGEIRGRRIGRRDVTIWAGASIVAILVADSARHEVRR